MTTNVMFQQLELTETHLLSSVCQSEAGTACIFTTSIKVQVMHSPPAEALL
jgi:hypothetical protein